VLGTAQQRSGGRSNLETIQAIIGTIEASRWAIKSYPVNYLNVWQNKCRRLYVTALEPLNGFKGSIAFDFLFFFLFETAKIGKMQQHPSSYFYLADYSARHTLQDYKKMRCLLQESAYHKKVLTTRRWHAHRVTCLESDMLIK
jgi:hypothetical protein